MKIKMLPQKAASFETIVALLTLVTLLIKTNSHTSEETLFHFGCYVVKTKLSYQESFVPVNRLEWKSFHSGFRDPEILVTGAIF